MTDDQKSPKVEALKEGFRWILSGILSTLILYIPTQLNLIPELVKIKLGDYFMLSFQLRVFVQFVILPVLIRTADKFKHVKGKNAEYDAVKMKHIKTGKSYGFLPL